MAKQKAVASQRSKTTLKAVILAGGQGTRLRPLTSHLPKSMLPVLNRPFLEHTMTYLKKYRVEHTILALSYLPYIIRDYFGDGSNLGMQLTYIIENDPMGTAGAVKNAEQYLTSTFAVLNGDIFTELDIDNMLTFHRRKGAKATIALTWVDDPSAFGVVETDSDGRVKHFIEKPGPDQVATNWINAGIYILEPEVLKHVPENSHYMFEQGLFPLLLGIGEPVYGYPFNGYWLDMGTPEKYLHLNCDLLLLKAKSILIQGLSRKEIHYGGEVIVHPSAKIAGPAIIGSGCEITRGVSIKGPVVIGRDCYMGERTSIDEAVLWSGSNIGAGATLKQCVVGSNTRIGDNDQVINRVVIP